MLTIKKILIIGALINAFFINKTAVLASTLVLNEIYANPVNEDDEFIEIYNLTDLPLEIGGYKLTDLTNKPYIIPEATIAAKSFLVIKKLNFQLNNSGQETVTLKDKEGNTLDSFSYEGTKESTSFSRFPDGTGDWIAETPVTENSTNRVNPSPIPTPNSTLSPSPSPSPSPVLSPSPSPKISPALNPSPSLETEIKLNLNEASKTAEVLGEKKENEINKSFILPLILIGLGLSLIIIPIVVFIKTNYYNHKHDQKTNSRQN